MTTTIPILNLLKFKVPGVLMVGLLAAQYLFFAEEGGPEPKCVLNIERPHYSTSLSEDQDLDAIKLNITSTCNVPQKYTQLNAYIQKIQNNREVTAYSFENQRRSSIVKARNVVSFKDLFAACKKGSPMSYRGVAKGYVYLESGKKLTVKGDSGKFVAVECLLGAQ